MKTKKLLLEQFAEETQNLMQKHERDVIGLRQKHSVCENNFKIQIENATERIKSLESKLEKEQKGLKTKIDYYEEKLARLRQSEKNNREKLEHSIKEKDRQNDEIRKINLNLESKLKLLSSEFQNRNQHLEDKIKEFETNQSKDLIEIKKLRDDIGNSMKEISRLQNELIETRENLSEKEKQCLLMADKVKNFQNQLEIEISTKNDLNDQIEALRETLKVSQNENIAQQARLLEIENQSKTELDQMKIKLTNQQSNYDELFRKSFEDKSTLENRLKNQAESFEKTIEELRTKLDQIKQELQKAINEKQNLQNQFDSLNDRTSKEKSLLEATFNFQLDEWKQKCSMLENKIKTLTEQIDSLQSDLSKSRNHLNIVENDLKSKNSEILNVHEKFNLLEMDRLSLLSDLENTKRLLHLESVEKKEKHRQIDELNSSLTANQIEIEKLKDVNEQLKRSLEDGDNLRSTLLKDCNELRETLTEVEKSRLEIKSKLNSSQFNGASLENQLKKKDLELDDIRRRLNTFEDEKKFWQQDLDSTSQSLTQMKTAYDRLYEQNVMLQSKLSQLETETKKRMSDSQIGPYEKETLRRLKRECEQSRERIAKLESEKKHYERLYIQMERDYNNLKASFNNVGTTRIAETVPYANGINNKAGHRNQNAKDENEEIKQDNQSASILSLTQLLKNDLIDTSSNPFDDTNRSLEQLRLKNNQLKQKILGKKNFLSTSPELFHQEKQSSPTSFATPNLDCCECLLYHQNNSTSSPKINDTADHHPNRDLLNDFKAILSDENRNHIDYEYENSFDEKLKQAEVNAQKVLESCEPEIRKLTKQSASRIKSAQSQSNSHSPIGSK
ncbi:hypothetical protein QR98_0061600 [Sarcoptes scabiei]|uniref:Uncharacterized protein n=1 Tax=Sarcoptes scabiei TaxID=52283 RepID=A0A132A9I7_SARSC|nr:hypothetical protein QR98_0061600 [Sarcoptes scabiei]